MRKRSYFVCVALVLLLSTVMITSIQVRAAPWGGYVKPSYTDYAPSGMPDFDEKQDAWGPAQGTYTWCVPTSVADILWWLDSKGESLLNLAPVAPPTISDHFNLVTSYNSGTWDDHDAQNVMGLVPNLALLMDTDGMRSHDGHQGTRWTDVQNGTLYYLKQQGVQSFFIFENSTFPNFAWIDNETYHCEAVVIGLEFWQLTLSGWSNTTISNPSLEHGHCLAIAGSDNTTNQLLICDPWMNAYENGLIANGREPIPDPQPGNVSRHNDAQYVSQDAYAAVQWGGPPPPGMPQGPWELQNYLQTMLGIQDPTYHAFITGAMAMSLNLPQNLYTLNVTVSPVGSGTVSLNNSGPYNNGDVVQLTANANQGWSFNNWSGDASGTSNPTSVTMNGNKTVTATFSITPWPGYVKPSYPDYAPSGIPDFDEKQDAWGPAQGTYTWCVPVATANSLWWLDSKFESLNFSAPVPPPTKSDHYALVTSHGQYDDHSPQNVDPLVQNLAMLMDTDGRQSHDGHTGTRWANVVPGINAYIAQQGLTSSFQVDSMDFASFNWIDNRVLQCQDVELFLEFWYFNGQSWQPVSNPSFEMGHCVTCAGSNTTTSQVLISDPYYDISAPAPNTSQHNDTQFVSHDPYTVAQVVFGGPLIPPPGYPPVVSELQNYLQIVGFSPDLNWHAFIRGAVETSPLGTHDIAVTSVVPAKTVVGQGYGFNVTSVVTNLGNYSESFNYTISLDGPFSKRTDVSTPSLFGVPAGNSTNIITVCNTTGIAYGNYTVTGHASIIPGETNTSNNDLSDGNVTVTIPGDIDGNFKVDLSDLVLLALAYGTTPANTWGIGHHQWNPNSDIDNSGKVDLSDLVTLATHYGKHYPP